MYNHDMTFEVKGFRPGESSDVVKKKRLDGSLQIISERQQGLQQGANRVLDVPFVQQESGVTCFWACCLAVQRSLKAVYGDRYQYVDRTETQLTTRARQTGLLSAGGTGIENPALPSFLREELGLIVNGMTGGAVEIVTRIFDDFQNGNITMVNSPYENIGHWNVVRGIVRQGDTVSFDLMDPIMGNHVVSAVAFADSLTHISKDGSITSATAVSFELPKPVFKVKSMRPAEPTFKVKSIRRPK